uniref:Uncharacterized protein n=1 Tax=Caenorhabditis japonica TaxID=281687 RepID=A0A8R1IK35_CAEJA
MDVFHAKKIRNHKKQKVRKNIYVVTGLSFMVLDDLEHSVGHTRDEFLQLCHTDRVPFLKNFWAHPNRTCQDTLAILNWVQVWAVCRPVQDIDSFDVNLSHGLFARVDTGIVLLEDVETE